MWRKVLGLMLGLLVLGAIGGITTAGSGTNTGESNGFQDISQKDIAPYVQQLDREGYVFFEGKQAVQLAEELTKRLGKKLTISLNFSELKDKNITFIGVAVRPASGRYITMFYIVQGQYDSNDIREFMEERGGFLKEPLTYTTYDEPGRDWKWIGSTSWKTKYAYHYDGKVYHAIRVKYYYATSTSGQYAYLAEISNIGDMDRNYFALKELYTRVTVPTQDAWFEDFLPFGHGGPQTQYYEEQSFNYGSFSGDLTYYASAGYSTSTNDAYYFRWDTHSENPNWDFQVKWYDFKKKTWHGDEFAWGIGFKTTSSVIEIVENSYDDAAFNYNAKASFYVRTMSGAIITIDPPAITFTNFVNPYEIS